MSKAQAFDEYHAKRVDECVRSIGADTAEAAYAAFKKTGISSTEASVTLSPNNDHLVAITVTVERREYR